MLSLVEEHHLPAIQMAAKEYPSDSNWMEYLLYMLTEDPDSIKPRHPGGTIFATGLRGYLKECFERIKRIRSKGESK